MHDQVNPLTVTTYLYRNKPLMGVTYTCIYITKVELRLVGGGREFQQFIK